MSTSRIQRRTLLAAALACGAARPRAWAQALPAAPGEGRLVVVFLRGALDGLSAFVPYADPDYARLRPNIALPAPDGSTQTTIRLDERFGLHPALAMLEPLWRQQVLAFVPAAGSPDGTRSHFDAQYQWETARPGQGGDAPGWLNLLAAQLGGDAPAHLVGVGEANPRLLAGRAPVRLVAHGQAARRAGVLENPRQRAALMALYEGEDATAKAFRAGAAARLQTARDLAPQTAQREMKAADNGAPPPAVLQQDARNLATLMRKERALRLGFLSAGGWDTHVNQGAATGALATNLGRLGAALLQLRSDFQEPGDLIVVASEFGRTTAENGNRGTDHGHGNAMWLIGDRVQGGRWHGQWSGLAPAALHEGRDLPVHHDFRAVLAQLLRPTFGLGERALADVLPGVDWDARLDGMLRRG